MFSLNCRGRLLSIHRPVVMGILNVTPDSFFIESRVAGKDAVLRKAGQMLLEGATILDLGGQSTRPGSKLISAEEEMERVIRPVEWIHENFPEAFISIDTFYSSVAHAAVGAGASIINDISAGSIDERMIETVVSLGVPYVLMHMKGTPATMQADTVYEDVTRDVLGFLSDKLHVLREKGMIDVIVDPGFGFGKTIDQNFQLLHKFEVFQMLDAPVLAGLSRKSTIYKTLDTTAEASLIGTTVLNTMALLKGASILRVHDVKESVEAIKLFVALKAANQKNNTPD